MDGGGGDSFDPCECICSHEGAMRRLISLVRRNIGFSFTNKLSMLGGLKLSAVNSSCCFRHSKLFMMCEFFRFIFAAERFTKLLHG